MNKHYYGNSHPVNVFRNGVKLGGWKNVTQSSVNHISFPDTYNDTADVTIQGNTELVNGVVYDTTGNITSHNDTENTTVALPTLRKVGSVSDTFVPASGVHTKNISDWVVLDGSKNWGGNGLYTNLKEFTISSLLSPAPMGTSSGRVYKYTSELLAIGNPAQIESFRFSGTNFVLSTQNSDTGWGFNSYPSIAEIKAYFYGYRMMNADSTTPYYKSECPYTPSTWTEWNTLPSGVVVKESTGITLNFSTGLDVGIYMSATLKPNTKYGFLYNVINTNITGISSSSAFNWGTYPTVLGNNKRVLTSISSLTDNKVYFYSRLATGCSIKLKDIRVFELPTGSQIEADFTNLTADQLCAKYTFNGLCVKNWQKLMTGDKTLTTVCPTASYEGYTPYKILYQLATPVVETLEATPLPTYYPMTVVETDCINAKPVINATAKVVDL